MKASQILPGRSGLRTLRQLFLITAHAVAEFACVVLAAFALGEIGTYREFLDRGTDVRDAHCVTHIPMLPALPVMGIGDE